MRKRSVWIFVTALMTLGVSACDDADGNGTGGTGSGDVGEVCATGEFRLTGTLDGVGLDLLETTRTYYMVNIGEPEFAGDSNEGSMVQLYWGSSISNNQATDGRGAASFSAIVGDNEAVCARSARIMIADSGMQFELSDLVSGDCDSTVPVEGTISGCVNSD